MNICSISEYNKTEKRISITPDIAKKYIDLGLNVIGLMCLPPNDNKSQIYFSKMKELVRKLKLKDISMGMSNDYLEAISYQSTYLRIGSKIFGERN